MSKEFCLGSAALLRIALLSSFCSVSLGLLSTFFNAQSSEAGRRGAFDVLVKSLARHPATQQKTESQSYEDSCFP
jgi:hypothetical protein